MVLTFDISIRTLKQILRSPGQIVTIAGFPILLVLIFSFLLVGGSSIAGQETSYVIGVINEDEINSNWQTSFDSYIEQDSTTIFNFGFGNYFLNSLSNTTQLKISDTLFRIKEFSSKEEVQQQVRSRSVVLGIIIPATFSQSMLSGINYRINLTEGIPIINNWVNANTTLNILGDSNFKTFQTVLREVNKAIEAFISHFYGFDLSGGHFSQQSSDVTSYELTAFDRFIPGIFVFGIILGASNISYFVGQERTLGTIDRLRLSRIKPAEYLIGILISQLIALTLGISLMLATGYLLGFNGRGNPFFAIFIGFLSIFPVMGFAVLVAGLDKTGENASGIMSILSAPIGFLSGAFFPLPKVILIDKIIPDGTGGLKALELWDFNPFRMAVRAEQLILLNQFDLNQVFVEIIFIISGGIIFLGIGSIFFVTQVFKDSN